MDGIQAAVLSITLRHLEGGNEAHRRNAELYGKCLTSCEDVAIPQVADYSKHVFHLYVVRLKNRDHVLQALGARGISCGIHYPKPIHLQEAYAHLNLGPGSLPVTERCAEEILSLPMFPELTEEQIGTVAQELSSVLRSPSGHAAIHM